MTCTVQVSLDLQNTNDALHVARIAVDAGVDWIEAGTGLIAAEGMAVVRALRAQFPRHPIVCDFKVCDGGEYFARLAGEAGATHFDVMAACHDATLRGAVREAKHRGLCVLADTMCCADPLAAAMRAASLGVDMICWHLGGDHRRENQELTALDGLDELLKAVRIPVQVVGGLSADQALEAARRGAASVVIGAPFVPLDRGPQLAATLGDITRALRD
jgi:3-hexulose-6-phosphate synthase/6-phospho-3-hexuloisomerase